MAPTSIHSYKPVCTAICKLLPGMVEVVLHDFHTGKIAHLENASPLRSIGDDSLLETKDYQSELDASGTIGPYPKYQADGAKLKSISAVLRDENGHDIGLLCINLRVSALESVQASLALLTSITDTAASSALVKNDWREIANSVISEQLSQRQVSVISANRVDREAIVEALQRSSVFEARGSTAYVATALGISRANLYNLIKSIKSTDKTNSKAVS